jgi:hypothetical protein
VPADALHDVLLEPADGQHHLQVVLRLDGSRAREGRGMAGLVSLAATGIYAHHSNLWLYVTLRECNFHIF